MYYIVRNDGVEVFKDLNQLTRKSDITLTHEDFKCVGSDHIIYLNPIDVAFCQDAKKLSTIALNKLFKADPMPRMILYIVLGLQVLTFLK